MQMCLLELGSACSAAVCIVSSGGFTAFAVKRGREPPLMRGDSNMYLGKVAWCTEHSRGWI